MNPTKNGILYSNGIRVLCGPLLNYNSINYDGENPIWHGTVLIVAQPSNLQPFLELKCLGDVSSYGSSALSGESFLSEDSACGSRTIQGVKLYQDPDKAFWRFQITLPLQAFEARWQYAIPNIQFLTDVAKDSRRVFVVPSTHQSVRFMFHSCNGFSVGTDEDFWSGPALWQDVLKIHQKRPFHVMIGGGDQIYSDKVMVTGPLKPWTDIANPKKRRDFPFSEQTRADCDRFYYDTYVEWYSKEHFASANSQIPQINIWDDHDIIDGFGSYVDMFMRCAVFRGIGGIAFKYYRLFQHHVAPPQSTFPTDAKATKHASKGLAAGPDPAQLRNTFVLVEPEKDPSWIIGKRPGPYIEERSRSIYTRLGRRMAFVGIDGRTERTRRQINYRDTYDEIFSRLNSEIAASHGDIKHLIILLGVPIVYPRLPWLENILISPLIAPIRLMNKRFGFAGSFFNHFDGNIEILDDLDDHFTSHQHKKERKYLVIRLQEISKKSSVRVTILGGDVHLAAVGRFYSNPHQNVPVDYDHRYMVNVISSAITNQPPFKVVANLLARRNKIHHLDRKTDETLMKLFDKQPGGKEKGASWNKCTMPSRNFACITEVPPANIPTVNRMADGVSGGERNQIILPPSTWGRNGHSPLHRGEVGSGTTNPVADGVSTSGLVGGLDVAIRVEIDNTNSGGVTDGYGFSIPPLVLPLPPK